MPDQGLEPLLIDLPPSCDPQTCPKLVPHAHVGYPALATQTRKLSPRALLRPHFHQQVQGMHGREQAEQMAAQELSGGVLAVPATSATVRPALIDKIVGDERSQQFEQCGRAGRRKVGVHEPEPTAVILTRQRQRQPPCFSAHCLSSEVVVITFGLLSRIYG